MKKLYLLAALLLITATACKRLDGDTLCEGTVVDRHTNARVANATVGVYERGSSGGGLGGGYSLKEEHQADANGNFAFQISSDAEDMILQASSPQGHYTRFQDAPNLRGGKNNKKLVLKTQAPAWLRIRIRSLAPHDTANLNFWGFSPTGAATGLVYGRDTSLITPVPGNVTSQVYWEINRSRQPLTTGHQEVYCPGLDTTDLEVTY